MAAKPPVIKIPPPPASSRSTPAFTAFVNKWSGKYPGLKQWAPQILTYAKEVHIDPVYFASVMLTESGLNQNIGNSSAGAVGIAQIMPLHIGEAVPWNANATVTAGDLKNPVFALRWAAYHLRSDIGNYGYQNAYSQGYNPGYQSDNNDPLKRIPKGYLPGVTTPGTSGAAGSGTPTGAASNPIKDPWVVATSKGQVKYVNTPTAPKGVLRDQEGNAITQSQYAAEARSLDTLYLAYTGVTASARAVIAYIRNPISDPELTTKLSNPQLNPRFYKSPIWLTHSPDYQAVYQNIYGPDANVNSKQAKQLITYGVVHNLSQTAFEEQLRQQPNYNTSEEYKANSASFQTGYQSIYGTPDATGKAMIDKATRAGWNNDQWMQFLRAQPEYTASGEFQKNVYNLFNSLGFSTQKAQLAPPLAFGPQAPTPPVSLTATGSAPSNG